MYSKLMNTNGYSIVKILFTLGLFVWGIFGLINILNIYFIYAVNIMIHESGHFIFFFMPTFFHFFAGTMMQILMPNLFLFYFIRRRSYYSASVMLFWIATNLFMIAPYIKDARTMNPDIPSLIPGGIHDWNYMLGQLNLLNYDQIIGNIVLMIGIIYLLLSLVLGIYFSKKEQK